MSAPWAARLPLTIHKRHVTDADGSTVLACSDERTCPNLFKEDVVEVDGHFACPECGRLGQRMVTLFPEWGAYRITPEGWYKLQERKE